MPRYYNIICEFCGKPDRKPGNKKPKYCSHECYNEARRQEISDRIGEPLDIAIQRRYVLFRMSYREIEQELGIANRTIMRTLERLRIEPRQGSDAVKTQWENNDERRQATSEMLKQYLKGRTGEKHPRWRGGFKYDTCSKSWCELAEQIRKRDGYRCTRCGKTNDENLEQHNKCLAVHHIIPFILSNDNSPENLRTLCLECHRIVEREFIWVL